MGVALLWGLTFPLIEQALDDLSPFHFMAARFLVAALACTPLVLASRGARQGLRGGWLAGAGLGVASLGSRIFPCLLLLVLVDLGPTTIQSPFRPDLEYDVRFMRQAAETTRGPRSGP